MRYLTAFLVIFFAALLSTLIFGAVKGATSATSARRRGLYPADELNPTIEEITRMAKNGEKILAIRFYRQLHSGVGLKEAKDEVEKLAAS